MNILRQTLGLTQNTCASDSEITAAAPDIIVLVGVSTAFFSPNTYSQKGLMEPSVAY